MAMTDLDVKVFGRCRMASCASSAFALLASSAFILCNSLILASLAVFEEVQISSGVGDCLNTTVWAIVEPLSEKNTTSAGHINALFMRTVLHCKNLSNDLLISI